LTRIPDDIYFWLPAALKEQAHFSSSCAGEEPLQAGCFWMLQIVEQMIAKCTIIVVPWTSPE
jgi:hypothetical protein